MSRCRRTGDWAVTCRGGPAGPEVSRSKSAPRTVLRGTPSNGYHDIAAASTREYLPLISPSAHLNARAPIVDVGLFAPPVVMELPSQITRPGTLHARCQASTTEFSGESPIRHVPIRCQPGPW